VPRVAETELRRRITLDWGYDRLEEALESGQGVVLALPHVGSWEWGGAFLATAGHPMTTVAERVEPEELFEWFLEQRREIGLDVLPLDDEATGRTLLKVLREGGLVGLVCDRDLVGNGIEVEFFGERTTLPAGPATLALRTGSLLFPAAVFAGPAEHHFAVVTTPVDTARGGTLRTDVARITQELAHRFEWLIRRAPEQWHLYQPNWPSDETPTARLPGPAPASPDPKTARWCDPPLTIAPLCCESEGTDVAPEGEKPGAEWLAAGARENRALFARASFHGLRAARQGRGD